MPGDHFCEFLSKAIDVFMLINKSDSISPSTLWEMLKVGIREQMTFYSISRRRVTQTKVCTENSI